ncbi:helix-turn-helix domain-containing protein [Mucilaginibacter sp. X5P1]|uniref:helix-turn-helix domain-containing protein n=1 Tax=Mucilaginibacter sp. X5P1 TaxID=2723088 RepID=UPI00161927A2|nr:helix-turn-helix domain-containing protein [Mucilaginibacter sp. X5P1]MBB6141955.1 AraC-like DNA-binding protein [Mucilaginibacter sp. X5P1]
MPIEFEFKVRKNYHFITAFASHFNAVVKGDKVYLPDCLGDGYIQQIYLDGMALFIHNYKLKQELILKRQPTTTNESITIKFDRSKYLSKYSQQDYDPFSDQLPEFEVEMATSNFYAELTIPENKQINFLIIGTSRSYLIDLLKSEKSYTILDLVKTHPSFVIHELIRPEMDGMLKQIIQVNETTELPMLLYKTKAHELIYYLFKSLFKRPINVPVNIKREDAEKIYLVRIALLRDFSKCPLLPELAEMSGLGLTKLQKLFSQIFGQSIHNYYQTVRMMQACSLLTHLSVSETGHKLGFTNLSHFTRLFEKHHQIKPKHFKNRLISESNYTE